MSVKAAIRIVAVVLLVLALMPLQLLAIRLGWPLRRTLPRRFHRIVLGLIGVAVETRGAPDRRRPLLIVANHVSWLDICVYGSAESLSFVSKSEVAGWPGIGLLARLQRSIFVERARRSRTAAATAEIGARLSSGDAMLLFAEGTTGDGRRVLPFRSALIGAAREAFGVTGEVVVQPVAIRYVRRGGLPIGREATAAIAWTGNVELAPHLASLLAGGPIDVIVAWGEPMLFTASTDRKVLARNLERSVSALLRASSFSV